jgi:hypothetical protein
MSASLDFTVVRRRTSAPVSTETCSQQQDALSIAHLDFPPVAVKATSISLPRERLPRLRQPRYRTHSTTAEGQQLDAHAVGSSHPKAHSGSHHNS